MKYILAILFCAFQLQFLQAQHAQDSLKLKFDHESLLVSDMQKSADFYRDVLLLNEMKSPLDGPDRKWFSLGGNYQLHLIREDRKMVQNDVATHFSLSINDLDAYIAFLEKKGVKYTNWPTTEKAISIRPDNVRQIYVQDPDGYWIEVNDATY
ncbi:VOC family protein [Flavimarina sp. Hel_I_48]|uniref:VOC family protein n=1 Tax=Flavimarina sp. Hel_I_48 TaxID=1392488 RepID=UPI000569C664|nr:VOC family protein [Flavimarina sp. Hel_I_48]